MSKHLIIFFSTILILKLASCAKIGSPQGGPKDSIPPVIAMAKPNNLSTNFKEKKITIQFDEYIKLNNIATQFIMSPPLEQKPIIKPESGVSKKITIEFLEELKPETTYTLNFGNSIVDNNEGNELGKLTYVFSTGKYLDSLIIGGEIKDPFVKDSINNINVFAYKNVNDSIVGNYTPDYIANSQKDAFFTLENLSEANYKLVALEDINFNYKYDVGLEKIGFIEDSIPLSKNIDSIKFTLFTEPIPSHILRPIQTKGNQIILGYKGSQKPKVDIKGLDKKDFILTKKTNQDSIYFWFKTEIKDSITITSTLDSLQKEFTILPRRLDKDTINIKRITKAILHPKDTFCIASSTPISEINKDSIFLYMNDSIPVNYNVINKIKNHKIYFNFKQKNKTNYSLIIKDSAFTDFLGQKNKNTKKIQFKTIEKEDYGEFKLQVNNPNNLNLLVELTFKDLSDKITKSMDHSGIIHFKNLEPSEYFVRIIKDKNNNSKYDTGNFKRRIQPEKIVHLKNKTIFKVRANSEIIENLVIQ